MHASLPHARNIRWIHALQVSELGCGCAASRHPAKRRISARLNEAQLACSKWQLQAHGLRTGASETVDELTARRSRILSRAQRDPDYEQIK